MSAEPHPADRRETRPVEGAEAARLRALQRLGIFDAAREPAFEALAAAVQRLLRVPMSNVVVVGSDTLHVWNSNGRSAYGVARERSMTHEVVGTGAILVLADARVDARFAAHPTVSRQEMPVVSYVGIPLKTSDGQVIGALCAIDHVPREPPCSALLATIEALARSAVTVLELKASRADHTRTERELARRKNILAVTLQGIDQGVAAFDADGHPVFWNRRDFEIKGMSDGGSAAGPDMTASLLSLARLGAYGSGDPMTLAARRMSELRELMKASLITRSLSQVREIEFGDGRTVVRTLCMLDGGCLFLLRDITEQRRRERELIEEARDYAIQSDVAALANAATSVPEALVAIADHLGRTSNYETAQAYRLTPDGLRSLGRPYLRAGAWPAQGVGTIPGGSGRPTALALLASKAEGGIANSPELAPGALGDLERLRDHAGVTSGMAVALRTPRDTYVIEFFDRREMEGRPALRALVSHLEAQLSCVEDRARAERQRGELMATISHELRTPLTAMAGMVELLQSGLFGDFSPATTARLTAVSGLSVRLAQMVETMLRDAPGESEEVIGRSGRPPERPSAPPLPLVA